MDVQLFETLLNESEGQYLDFKREQYFFENSDDRTKSDILKDILAFANAWRRIDAYILIGVEEVKGGRSKVLGISDHLDDHSLQQFVNSKTQKPIEFSYTYFEFEGKQVGVLKIPVQSRPAYLKQDYGKLKKHVVYIRRGSSTDEAEPEEIAKMGMPLPHSTYQPNIQVEFANPKSRSNLGVTTTIESMVLEITGQSKIPDFEPRSEDPFGINFIMKQPNRHYYRQLVEYYRTLTLLRPVGFYAKNTGQVIASNTRVILEIGKRNGVVVSTREGLPGWPEKFHNLLSAPMVNLPAISSLHSRVDLEFHNNTWTLTLNFGNIQPKAEEWIDDMIFIGAEQPNQLILEAKIFADNPPEPLSIPMSITINAEPQLMSLDELIRRHNESMEHLYDEIDKDD